jgi:hypothetical protein
MPFLEKFIVAQLLKESFPPLELRNLGTTVFITFFTEARHGRYTEPAELCLHFHTFFSNINFK